MKYRLWYEKEQRYIRPDQAILDLKMKNCAYDNTFETTNINDVYKYKQYCEDEWHRKNLIIEEQK